MPSAIESQSGTDHTIATARCAGTAHDLQALGEGLDEVR